MLWQRLVPESLHVKVSYLLQIDVRNRNERQWGLVIASYKGVVEGLQRSHSLPWVYLQNLLDEVDELKYFSAFVHTVLEWHAWVCLCLF